MKREREREREYEIASAWENLLTVSTELLKAIDYPIIEPGLVSIRRSQLRDAIARVYKSRC